MILIDAVFINNGGGKILLDYLYDKITENNLHQYLFLIDERLRDEYKEKNNPNIELIFIKGFSERCKFYNNKINFSKVLCFGNVPPNKRLNCKVYTYFHQLIYLNIPKEFSFVEKIKFRFKINILRLFKKNTDVWITQNNLTKDSLSRKFKITVSDIEVLPFYPPITGEGKYSRNENSFLYVSNANPHKNHKNLINAFCNFFDQYNIGILTLTVNNTFPEIIELINDKIKKGYPINNVGFVTREALYKEYQSHQYLIFPSLAESFGLGLVEAIENNCKVIVSDLPFAHQVCVPSIAIKNPFGEQEILQAMISGIQYEKIPFSEQKIHDEIEKLLKLIK
ncbi:glycosyltransferase [Chryseobacterium sp. PMSZPI]|uniref:glycosyltransferase n=1 Tax=Chryseobacterium sp. PMSZPI TaxID=1033900 RepID=UPI000C33ED4C|nr:glycosyltransferase [Chryseobacterium sp. PMSZPI]PKF74307.1 hypothetical protein CW752_10300 [Chryseobacterium sp. PMSZPI]